VKSAKLGVAAALCVAATLAVQPLPAYADSTREKQWHLSFLKAAEAQKYSQGQGVTVAVIDSGVDANHPDLRGSVVRGTDIVPRGSGDGRGDNDGHGTAMAGLIVAHGHGSNDGVLGVAPKARLLPIRVENNVRRGNADEVARGIDTAVDRDAKVISISWGVGRSASIREAVDHALAADIVLVSAAGNTSEDTFVPYPGGVEGVLTVAATDRNGSHASISVAGPEVDLAAPGVDITSTNSGGGYRTDTGTSDSTAIVAGAVALVRAKFPNLSADEVIHRLTATATDKGPPGRDDQYGFGVLNLVAALTADVSPATEISGSPTARAPASPSTTAVAAPAPRPSTSSDHATTVVVVVALLALLAACGIAWLLVSPRNRTS
jgi:type VII secretion-associated serine protease mycosin